MGSRPILRDAASLIVGTLALWTFFLGGAFVVSWALWDRSMNPASFGYYLHGVVTNLPVSYAAAFPTFALASALASLLTSRHALAVRRPTAVLLLLLLLVSVVFVGNVALWAFAAPGPNQESPTSCTYQFFISGSTPVAWSRSAHATVRSTVASSGDDLGALVNALPESNQVLCFAPGIYALDTGIRIYGQSNVSLILSKGAVLGATNPLRLLDIQGSTGVTVMGGTWVGHGGTGNYSNIMIEQGSSEVTIEGVDSSGATRDGVQVRNDTTPDLRVSILDNHLHDNARFGAQDFEPVPTQSLDVTISGNVAENNGGGGIYTNGVVGAHIVGNTVSNTAGTLPGRIGIGVTNGANDTIIENRVAHMNEYGIQIFYNNGTLVADNYASFNAGASDQSGITNDHSFYDKLVNNTVVFNGVSGIHVERSSYVTIRGNNASGNGRFGIEFYHGTLASVVHELVTGNACSNNGQAGIILNSGADSLITHNRCLDNSGPGVLLYNDVGQPGCTGNIIANNSLGDDRASPSARTQTYGVEAVNGAKNNIVQGNSFFNNTISNLSLVGPNNVVTGNVTPVAPNAEPTGLVTTRTPLGACGFPPLFQTVSSPWRPLHDVPKRSHQSKATDDSFVRLARPPVTTGPPTHPLLSS